MGKRKSKKSGTKRFTEDHVTKGNRNKDSNTLCPQLAGAKVKSLKRKGGKKGERALGWNKGEKLYATKSKLPYTRQHKDKSDSEGEEYHVFVGKKKNEEKVVGLHYTKAISSIEDDSKYSYAPSSGSVILSAGSVRSPNNGTKAQKLESWKQLIQNPEQLPHIWKIDCLWSPSLIELKTLCELAQHGKLSSVNKMYLENIDITGLSLDALTSIVSDKITIDKVIGDLTSILSSLKCKEIGINSQSLSKDETSCLLTAMRQSVEVVILEEVEGKVQADVDILTMYDGKGRCREITCCASTGGLYDRLYGFLMRKMAERIGWGVKDCCVNSDTIYRINVDMINTYWISEFHIPNLTELLEAARLAQQSVLTNVKCMTLKNIDVSRIPHDNLASLSSIVTDVVWIDTVTENISAILENFKCRVLHIYNQTLCSDTTLCLLTAMRNVEEVGLGTWGCHVKFDIDILTGYIGQGKCRRINAYVDINSRTKVENWAADIGWKLNTTGYDVQEYFYFDVVKPEVIKF